MPESTIYICNANDSQKAPAAFCNRTILLTSSALSQNTLALQAHEELTGHAALFCCSRCYKPRNYQDFVRPWRTSQKLYRNCNGCDKQIKEKRAARTASTPAARSDTHTAPSTCLRSINPPPPGSNRKRELFRDLDTVQSPPHQRPRCEKQPQVAVETSVSEDATSPCDKLRAPPVGLGANPSASESSFLPVLNVQERQYYNNTQTQEKHSETPVDHQRISISNAFQLNVIETSRQIIQDLDKINDSLGYMSLELKKKQPKPFDPTLAESLDRLWRERPELASSAERDFMDILNKRSSHQSGVQGSLRTGSQQPDDLIRPDDMSWNVDGVLFQQQSSTPRLIPTRSSHRSVPSGTSNMESLGPIGNKHRRHFVSGKLVVAEESDNNRGNKHPRHAESEQQIQTLRVREELWSKLMSPRPKWKSVNMVLQEIRDEIRQRSSSIVTSSSSNNELDGHDESPFMPRPYERWYAQLLGWEEDPSHDMLENPSEKYRHLGFGRRSNRYRYWHDPSQPA